MIDVYLPGYTVDFNNRPETYKTILTDNYGHNTETSKVRRRMIKAVRTGVISSRAITVIGRGRDVIFFQVEKEYFIVYSKTSCFYCSNINPQKESMILEESYELKESKWISKGNVELDVSEVELCF